MNNVTLVGTIDKVWLPKGEGPTKFKVAVREAGTKRDGSPFERTEWVPCKLWKGEVPREGTLATVVGKVVTDTWEKNGEKVYSTLVDVTRVTALGADQAAPRTKPQDDDIPF
jgi:single-stranded DNA-binding protein